MAGKTPRYALLIVLILLFALWVNRDDFDQRAEYPAIGHRCLLRQTDDGCRRRTPLQSVVTAIGSGCAQLDVADKRIGW